MAVQGTRQNINTMGKGYAHDPISVFAESFITVAKDILQENQTEIFQDPIRTLMNEGAVETIKEYFCNQGTAKELGMNAVQYEEHQAMLNEQFETDRQTVINEYANGAAYNPVIGLSFPMHKNILMQNVFEKAIAKDVAVSPKFTISLETRMLVGVDGTEYDLFKEQMKIKEVMDAALPWKEVKLTLPEAGTTDILNSIGATATDNLGIETYISGIKVSDGASSSAEDITIPCNITFKPGYGDGRSRQFVQDVYFPVGTKGKTDSNAEKALQAEVKDVLSGIMEANKFKISCLSGAKIKGVVVRTRKDASNGKNNTVSATWKVTTDLVEIPNANPINVTMSPEEVKDVQALYQVNQLSKIMSIIKDVLGNYKDMSIKEGLDENFSVMDPKSKVAGQFDFAPRADYALDHVTWRFNTFFDALESYATTMLNVLRDPNMTITVIGRPDLIRKIMPAQYDYVAPESIGPVELEYSRVMFSSNKRLYQFISTMKMDDTDELIILIKPHNTNRIVYKVYDYQLYVSNDIRNAANPTLPAIHAFERFAFKPYQPVQGRVKILNPSGLK